MWNCVRNFVTSFCSESSVHGVKYLIKDKNIVSRCYWCVMLIVTLYCCGQFSILLSRRFLEIPIRMTIKEGQARTEKLPLPSITFCSENPTGQWYEKFLDEIAQIFLFRWFPKIPIGEMIKEGQVTGQWYKIFFDEAKIPPEYSRSDVLAAMRLGISHLTPLYVPDQKVLNVTLMTMLDHVLMYNDVTTREFVERVSVPCDVLLSRCQLRGQILPCAEIFQRMNGQCCRFKDDPETFVSSGSVFGNNLKVVTTMNYGKAYVAIHRPNSEPLIDQSSFTMSNGYYVMFYIDPLTVLKSEEVHEMEEEAGICAHPDEQELRFFDSYDYMNCVEEWIINASIAVCGCAGTYTPAPDRYTCNFTRMNCLRSHGSLNRMNYGLTVEDFLEGLAAPEGIEMQKCPEACTYTLYLRYFNPTILVAEYDHTGFLTGVDPKNEYVVNFAYKSQFYKIQEFVLIVDWITLLSNLGGVYGLFLGCSMLTLAEFIFYLWSRIVRKIWIADRVSTARTLVDE